MTDFDPLKVPAYLRKRSLAAKDRRKLLWTALDREKAGTLKEGEKPLATAFDRQKAGLLRVPKNEWEQERQSDLSAVISNEIQEEKIDFILDKPYLRQRNQVPETVFTRKKTWKIETRKHRTPKKIQERAPKLKEIGEITHYYSKINVGVILLSKTLIKGEKIIYGGVCQEVNSMQIDRRNIEQAKKGQEIGLKLTGVPTIGEKVYKMM